MGGSVITRNDGTLPHARGRVLHRGVTEAELIEAITHLAFHAGWPRAMAAMAVAKQVFTN